MDYRCETTSVTGFVQQLATAYLPHGYWFYVTGQIPLHKDPRDVDQKLLAKYGIAISRPARARRKRAGQANLHYLRHEQFFVLLATHGRHTFFDHEAQSLRDIRRTPLVYGGYSISYKRGGYVRRAEGQPAQRDERWHSRVQIARGEYRTWRALFLEIAAKRTADQIAAEFWKLPFEPYAPVRQQQLNLLRLVNRARRQAGLDRISPRVLRYRRRIVRPFEPFARLACDETAQAMASEEDDSKCE